MQITSFHHLGEHAPRGTHPELWTLTWSGCILTTRNMVFHSSVLANYAKWPFLFHKVITFSCFSVSFSFFSCLLFTWSCFMNSSVLIFYSCILRPVTQAKRNPDDTPSISLQLLLGEFFTSPILISHLKSDRCAWRTRLASHNGMM